MADRNNTLTYTQGSRPCTTTTALQCFTLSLLIFNVYSGTAPPSLEPGSQTGVRGTLASCGDGEWNLCSSNSSVMSDARLIGLGFGGFLSCFVFDVLLQPLVSSSGGLMGRNYPGEGTTSHSEGVALPSGGGAGLPPLIRRAGTQRQPVDTETVCKTKPLFAQTRTSPQQTSQHTENNDWTKAPQHRRLDTEGGADWTQVRRRGQVGGISAIRHRTPGVVKAQNHDPVSPKTLLKC